ncbi:MAG: paraquat-inducible protein A [Pseudomonadota bacterium]
MRASAIFTAILASILLFAGLTLPLMTVTSLYFFTDAPSLLSLVSRLWTSGEVALALIVAIFAVAFPIAKLATILAALVTGRFGHFVKVFDVIGKWSMLDVMIVAIAIVALKITGLQSISTELGLFAFIGCVILTGLSAWMTRKLSSA